MAVMLFTYRPCHFLELPVEGHSASGEVNGARQPKRNGKVRKHQGQAREVLRLHPGVKRIGSRCLEGVMGTHCSFKGRGVSIPRRRRSHEKRAALARNSFQII